MTSSIRLVAGQRELTQIWGAIEIRCCACPRTATPWPSLAYQEDGGTSTAGTDNSTKESGAVVFGRSGSAWAQQGCLKHRRDDRGRSSQRLRVRVETSADACAHPPFACNVRLSAEQAFQLQD